jgi:hypothetical protein
MTAPPNVNDGSSSPARVVTYGNGWGLLELPKLPREGAKWSLQERLDRLVAEGFGGFQTDVKQAEEVRRRGLRFATSGRVNTPDDVDKLLKSAADAGADCITLHAGWGDEPDDQIDALVRKILESSEWHRVPAYIETHRATICQDVWRTSQLIGRIPEVRFNGDFSHFYCGQEMDYAHVRFQTTGESLRPIFQRTSFFHGRISDGQCMQAHVDDPQSRHVQHFRWMWEQPMSEWLKRARPGDILPFAPELGPPSSGYSITYKDGQGRVVEISDRWQQSVLIKRMAEAAFKTAQATEAGR